MGRRTRRLRLGAGAVSTIVFAGSIVAAPPAAPIVRVTGGLVRGVIDGDVTSYKDIPFAAPPVGDLRWRAPAPVQGWAGIRPAADYGPACMQTGGSPPALMALPQSEDCLTVNVWAPTKRSARALPVMVWIYGGGFTIGAARQYDGASFARDGVVMVTFNYRVGRLGWFSHPGLMAESAGGPVGDYGLMDQIAALKWVRANIARFGGDPRKVTVFGESAGAMSINYLMISPQARGLFSQAIAESGFGRTPAHSIDAITQLGEQFASTLGVGGSGAAQLKGLRALSASAIMADHPGPTAPDNPQPIVDGHLIPEQVATAFAAGRQAKVRLLIGGNSEENSIFPDVARDPERFLKTLGDRRERVVDEFGAGDPARATATLWTDLTITEPDRFLARAMTRVGEPAYLYFFAYRSPAQRNDGAGVSHGGEVGYVFDNPAWRWAGKAQAAPAVPPEDLATAKLVHTYWINFAKTGMPSAPGSPVWPTIGSQGEPVMVFADAGPGIASNFDRQRLDDVEKDQSVNPCDPLFDVIRRKSAPCR